MNHLIRSGAHAALEIEAQTVSVLGIATGLIAEGTPSSLAQARGLLAEYRIPPAQALAMRDRLLRKAEKDQRVSAAELAFFKRFSEVTEAPMPAIVEGDNRSRVAFQAGMKVYLSGGPGKAGSACEGMSKADLKERCQHTGLIFFTSGMRKKDNYDGVVVADLSTEGKSRANAERWGFPVMSWEELLEWAQQQ